MSLFIDEVVEENAKLKEIEELKEELQIAKDNYKSLEWHNNNQYELLNKYKKAIDIAKRKKVNIFSIQMLIYEDYNKTVVKEDELTKEEYDLLKEVLSDEK